MLRQNFPGIDKHLCDPEALRVFIPAGMHLAVIKGKNLRSWYPKQDRRVRRDNKLRALFRHLRDLQKQSQLPLRRQRRLRLIHDIEPATGKRLKKSKETLAVRLPVQALPSIQHAPPRKVCILFRLGCHIEKTLRPEEITSLRTKKSFRYPHRSAQF